MRVVEALRLELVVVLPHPLYPLWSSAISDCMPTAGRVGSSLGLKPYSSTSFLRASSALFFDLRLRQNQRPASSSSATATTGITTAMAVFPAGLSPPVSCLFWGFWSDAGSVEPAPELVGDTALLLVGFGVLDLMTVWMTVMGVGVSSGLVAVGVTTEVRSWVDVGVGWAVTVAVVPRLVEGAAVEGAAEVGGAWELDGSGADVCGVSLD